MRFQIPATGGRTAWLRDESNQHLCVLVSSVDTNNITGAALTNMGYFNPSMDN